MRSINRSLSTSLTVALVTAASVVADPLADQPMIGQTAPGFTLESIRGGELSLADLRGKFVVIHFGASW